MPRKLRGARTRDSHTPSDETDAPYRVGYRRPPVNTRFKPGQSGNPRGRPKGHRNIKTVISEVLLELVQIREGDRSRKVPAFEALVRKLRSDAMRGDLKAMVAFMNLVRGVGLLGDDQEIADNAISMVDDAAIVAEFLSRNAPVDRSRRPRG